MQIFQPVRSELLEFVHGMTDPEILDLLDTLSMPQLQRLADDMGPGENPDEDDEDEDEDEEFDDDDMPEEDYGDFLSAPVLMRLGELLYKDPPAPTLATAAINRQERAVVLAQRYEAGLGLWHPRDARHESCESPVNQELVRKVMTLSGWKAAGRPAGFEPVGKPKGSGPLDNGDEVVGPLQIRDYAGSRAPTNKEVVDQLRRTG